MAIDVNYIGNLVDNITTFIYMASAISFRPFGMALAKFDVPKDSTLSTSSMKRSSLENETSFESKPKIL